MHKIFGTFCLLGFWISVGATPFIPPNDAVVLERLPKTRQQVTIRQRPTDLKGAVALARSYIEQSRINGDPRYLGYAQGVLAPWWNQPQPPTEVLILKATIRQSTHDFKGALQDLDLVLKSDPHQVQALVTKATILTVQGEYAQAKRACAGLWQYTTELVTATCIGTVGSLNGQAKSSYNLIQRVLKQSPQATPGEKLWAMTVLGEIAQRLDQPQEAERFFKQGTALGADTYLLGAYADFLLDQKRPQEVIQLLQKDLRTDGLLLRLTLAQQMIQSPQLKENIQALKDRFAASKQRGDTVHRREESRFALYLLKDPQQALTLAQSNWQVQREPADVLIFLEAALAAKQTNSVRPVLTWLATNQLEDHQINRLAKQLGG